ncbi:MAG: hypothetical protein KatS3mg105_1638 [Gemmatales bacterium]|nr:MAG: hypothetical protein KatS3mg105_1638 [Gemmatales bacterium]
MLTPLAQLVLFCTTAMAQVPKDLPLAADVYIDSKGNKLPYRLLKPKNYDPKKKYPLVLFLHGAGERGTDNKKQLIHGIGDFVRNQDKYPCFVVVPQCPAGQTWADWRYKGPQPKEPTLPTKLSLQLVEQIQKKYSIDDKRLYITGLSMGGFGTWDVICRYPDKFAAAVPICGGGDPRLAEKIKDLPIWAFHGAKDRAVKPERSRLMIEAIKKAGGKPKYTEYPDVGHAAWVPAYRDQKLFEWLFSQKRP